MLNQQIGQQLDRVIKERKMKIKYPKGYQRWRKKFYATLHDTRGDVPKALEKIHGKIHQNSKSNS